MSIHPLWRPAQPLLLASKSPTRHMLLDQAGLPVETCPSQVDERAFEVECGDFPSILLAGRLAAAKAMAVAGRHPGRVVIGADQVLDCGGEVFHKPSDRYQAEQQLARLAGRTHALHAALCLVIEGKPDTFVETARLTMRALDSSAIAAYCDTLGEARATASVGAYQLEGLGIHLFEDIVGDHNTILGLPLLPLLARLRAAGFLRF